MKKQVLGLAYFYFHTVFVNNRLSKKQSVRTAFLIKENSWYFR